tara:strand:- start:31 stop:396 length:366 start_codon:yes stop_codon:yes gene_type:complete
MRKKIDNISIDENDTILNAMKKINLNQNREVLVVSKNKIKGILSEGDILRALLNEAQMISTIKAYYNKNFKYLLKLDYKKAEDLFIKFNFNIIPVVGKNFELKDFITFKELIKKKIKIKTK